MQARTWLTTLGLAAMGLLAGCGGGSGHGGNIDVAPAGTVLYTRNGDIWRMRSDGTGQTQLTTNDALDFQPALTPDGRWILFTSRRSGAYQLYRMKPDGRNLEKLTDGPGFAADPAISYDGLEVAFVSDRNGNDDLYALDLDTLRVRRITNTPTVAEQTPTWSPDDNWLAYSATPDATSNTDLFLCRSTDGSETKRLTASDSAEDSPAFSPDGKWIAFSSDRNGDFDIYALAFDDSTNVRRLVERAGDDEFPVYTTDGNDLLFDGERDGDSDIMRLSLFTGTIDALARSFDNETNPDTRATKNGKVAHLRGERK